MRNIKEKHCYVEQDDKKFDNEFGGVARFKLAKDKLGGIGTSQRKLDGDGRGVMDLNESQNPNDYPLPDGSKISLSQHDKSKAPEIMFRPSLIGLEYPGIHEIVN